MPPFYEFLRTTIGECLDILQARFLSEERDDEDVVCYISIRDRIAAIRDGRRNGIGCFVSDANPVPPYRYEDWETITSRLGLRFDLTTAEGTNDFLRTIPEGRSEYTQFVGKCLMKYFSTGEYA